MLRPASSPTPPAVMIDLRPVPPRPDTGAEHRTGSVAGGGALEVPAGSCARIPSAAGTASFGFSCDRPDPTRAPAGFVALTFERGDIRFRSSTFDWLLIVGPVATAVGSGSLNGTEGYSFKASARDGGRTLPDAFRLKIWLSATGAVIFDSDRAARGDVASPITHGSIAVLATAPRRAVPGRAR